MGKPLSTGADVLTYISQNPDRPITLSELEEALPFTRSQSSNAIGNLHTTGRYPNLERLQSGVYRWNSVVKPETPPSGDKLELTVVSTKPDGSKLVRDESTSDLFVLKPFIF